MQHEGAYFTDEHQTDLLRKLLFHPDGSMNTATVGKPAEYLAGMAGFEIPRGTRVLVTACKKQAKMNLFPAKSSPRIGMVRRRGLGSWL
jgi:hypothetical protein